MPVYVDPRRGIVRVDAIAAGGLSRRRSEHLPTTGDGLSGCAGLAGRAGQHRSSPQPSRNAMPRCGTDCGTDLPVTSPSAASRESKSSPSAPSAAPSLTSVGICAQPRSQFVSVRPSSALSSWSRKPWASTGRATVLMRLHASRTATSGSSGTSWPRRLDWGSSCGCAGAAGGRAGAAVVAWRLAIGHAPCVERGGRARTRSAGALAGCTWPAPRWRSPRLWCSPGMRPEETEESRRSPADGRGAPPGVLLVRHVAPRVIIAHGARYPRSPPQSTQS